MERLNHTIAQMLSMIINERQDDWDLCLPQVQAAYNNSVNLATGLAPNESTSVACCVYPSPS